ncbi:MAG: hypothetical protein EOO27_24060 [Comamonadaceae bacterium]|nr:MAG: hypothetical protein EOO27_24060 [Comamonadaceae bacterium]
MRWDAATSTACRTAHAAGAGTKAVTPWPIASSTLLHQGRLDLTPTPLVMRKRQLTALFTPPPPAILVVQHFDAGGKEFFDQAVLGLKLEGLVAKRAYSTYQPGVRSAEWVKVKRNGAVPAERFKRT